MVNSEDQARIRHEISRRALLGIGAAAGATAVLADFALPRPAYATGSGKTWYVDGTHGSDTTADGSLPATPFRTIRKAAEVAAAGDTVEVRAGVYREEIVLPRGGTSDAARITYQAAANAAVTITGSDVFTSWTQVSGDVWKLEIPNSYFNGFNPYAERVYGDWFLPVPGGQPDSTGRIHRRGMVYLNGAWLPQATDLAAVSSSSTASWWSEVDGLDEWRTNTGGTPGERYPSYACSYSPTGKTTITAKLPGVDDPNVRKNVEVGIRATVFKPSATNYDYITIKGFKLTNAATNWAAPTMGQHGLVSAHWCKGWVIEDNEIAYSRCCGVALGKYSDTHDGTRGQDDGTGYIQTITDAQATGGWSFANIGGHVVRNNVIHHCGQTGVVGSLGAIGSTITGNEIFQIDMQGIWSGYEMAGIKIHAAIDTEISKNHIYDTADYGIWLDWMAQGTRVLGNLLHNNPRSDIIAEVDHGPLLMANNIMLSPKGVWSWSEGVALAHNLVMGATTAGANARTTPYFYPHTTDTKGTVAVPLGAHQWHNNLVGGSVDLSKWDTATAPYDISMKANVYTAGAVKSSKETNAVDASSVSLSPQLLKKSDGWYLTVPRMDEWKSGQALVTTSTLAMAPTPQQQFTNTDGSAMAVDTDFLGTARSATNPFPGPFEQAGGSSSPVKVWSYDVPASISGPGAATDALGNITVHTRGADGQLNQRAFTGGSWTSWAVLGGPTGGTFRGSPALAARSGRTDVFVRGTDDQLWKRTWTSADGWGAWATLGGVLVDSPAAATDADGNITVHVRGSDNQIWQLAYKPTAGVVDGTGASWSSWGGPQGGPFRSAPALAARVGRTDVFVRGVDDQLWKRTWTSTSGLGAWAPLGGVLVDSPTAATDVNGNITVHVRGSDNQIWQLAYKPTAGVADGAGATWFSWGGPQAGPCQGSPALAARPGRTDVFVRGMDDQLWQRTWTSTAGLSAWTPLGGTFG